MELGFGRAKKGTSRPAQEVSSQPSTEIVSRRPMRNDEGSYSQVVQGEAVADGPNTIDASQFPAESHPLLHISERIKSKAAPKMAASALQETLSAPHSTGFAAKHDDGKNTL